MHDKAKSRKYCRTPKVKAYLRVFPSIIRAKSFSFRRASPRVVQWRLRVSLVPCKIKQTKMPSTFTPVCSTLRIFSNYTDFQCSLMFRWFSCTFTHLILTKAPQRRWDKHYQEKQVTCLKSYMCSYRVGTRLQITHSSVIFAQYSNHRITIWQKYFQ